MLARAQIIGYLGQDPEVRDLSNGNKVVSLSVATTRKWKDKDGEKQEKTSWNRVVVYNKNIADPCAKYLKTGSKVMVMGDLETRDYEKDGEKRTITEIIVSAFHGEVIFLDRKEGGGGDRAPAMPEETLDNIPY
jgi:single-strand DNA-binding protein